MLDSIVSAARSLFDPEPHPIAGRVARAADRVVRASHKLEKQSDAFADMVRGMRGESPRSKKKKQ